MAQEISSKIITLKTADGVLFEVEPNIAKEMQTVQSFIDEGITTTIPFPNLYSHYLAMVIDYCKKHNAEEENNDAIEKFDAEFAKELSSDEMKLKHLLVAAYYLDIKSLFEFIAKLVADHIKNMSVESVRVFFDIENDYTPEEEAKLRKEYEWAFEEYSDHQK